jgi:Kelch motif protein/VCBS repeat protein
MKKRSNSHSAFLNLRVLFGLFVMLAGVFLALVSFGTFSSVLAQTNRTELTHAQVRPVGVAPSGSAAVVWSDNRNDLPGGAPRKDPNVYYNKIGSASGPCDFRVLIAYADVGGPPTTLQNEILAQPGVTAVDLFDAFSGTPTLQQLEGYSIVFAFSNNGWNDAVAMGNVLADYQDGGGVVVVGNFAFDNRGPWLLGGRWVTGGYSPFNSTNVTNFSTNTANITQPSHALMRGVSSLSAFLRNGVTLTSGASAVAMWTDGPPAVAYKTNNGHTAVGLNAYLGSNPMNFSGEWGRVIVNAGKWLLGTRGDVMIYNIGGFGSTGTTNTTRIYDPGNNTWTTGAPLPTPLSNHATAYWNGKIYVAAGFNGSAAVNTLYIYDIANNTWTTGAPLPQALYLPGFGIVNGKLYVASGNNGSTELNTLYIYDIGTNTWTTGANVPTPVTGPGSAVYNGKLYLFGGGFPTTLKITQIYAPASNTWSSGPSMNVARLWFYGAAIDNTSIVAPGGDTVPGTPTNVSEQLTGSWAVRANLPYNARGPFAVSDGRFVYIGGGYDGSTVRADLLRYDPISGTYTPLAPSPDGHFLSQAVIVTRSTYDFNHDGKPDYVLYNASTHQTAVWYMNNNVFLGGAFGRTLPAGWNLIDVADFNGDGNPDYALFNPTTRQTAIWYLSGVTFIGGAFGPTLPGGWTLVATGDFNNDCEPDYVLYNASTRQTAIWYMNNNVFVSGVYGPTLPPSWSLVGVADFDGDGNRDYLLFNASTRQTAIWYLFGVTFVGSAYGPTIASGYQLQGTADFNGDGKPDYLLYNPSTRQTAIWYLNNNILLGGAFGPILPTGWNLVAP